MVFSPNGQVLVIAVNHAVEELSIDQEHVLLVEMTALAQPEMREIVIWRNARRVSLYTVVFFMIYVQENPVSQTRWSPHPTGKIWQKIVPGGKNTLRFQLH